MSEENISFDATFKNCEMRLEKIENIDGLNKKDLLILKDPRRVLNVNYPVRMDDGSVRMISAFRVQYNDALGPAKGGIRFHEDVSQEDVMELAFLMSLKTSLVGIPYGGAKGGVKINPKTLSQGELERVSRGFVKEMFRFIGPEIDIPAPDVNTDPKIMGWMMDEYERIADKKAPGSFTGKPIVLGGSLGRNEATARGLFFLLEEKFKNNEVSSMSVAVQGFGNAGSNIARFLSDYGFKVVAVSDSSSGVYDENGLDIAYLLDMKKRGKIFSEFEGNKISNDDILALDVDILVPSALGGVITKNNVYNVRARTIAELANAPITAEADAILNERGVEVIPDILANAGGVVVSYFEWVQNLQGYYWKEEEVNKRLKELVLDAYGRVLAETKKYSVDHRTASYSIAVKRILEAERSRGVI